MSEARLIFSTRRLCLFLGSPIDRDLQAQRATRLIPSKAINYLEVFVVGILGSWRGYPRTMGFCEFCLGLESCFGAAGGDKHRRNGFGELANIWQREVGMGRPMLALGCAW